MSIFERFEKHADRTFGEAATRYLSEFTGRDRARCEMAIRATLPYIGAMRLIEVDDEALKQFKSDRTIGVAPFDRPAMCGTVNKELTQVVTIMNRACRVWRWLPSAPKILHIGGDKRRGYPLSWEEQDRLFRELPTGWDVLSSVFAINTGVREEELFGLKWADLVDVPDLGAFVFVLNRTKNGEQRAVICNSVARRAVDAERKWQAKHGQDDHVFPRGRRPSANGKTWLTAWTRAGMPGDPLIKRGLHNLRHSCAQRLRAAGVSQEDRNAILGHARTNLAEHYALPDLRRLLEAVELITIRRDTAILRCQPAAPSARGGLRV